jgi:hypothetical protein
MKTIKRRHPCPETPNFAPSRAVGPNEFEHALECNECWAALIRWMDTEAINLPEPADIRGRAKRLAGVAEIMAAMAARGSDDIESIADEVFDDATLDDVLDATQREPTLIRGPWPKIAAPRQPRKKEKACAKSKTTSQSSPESKDECTAEMSTTETPNEEEGYPRPTMGCASWGTSGTVPVTGPVTADLGTDAIDLKIFVNELGTVVDGLSTTSAKDGLCHAVASYSIGPLCDVCADKGRCWLKEFADKADIPFLNLSICVPLPNARRADVPSR